MEGQEKALRAIRDFLKTKTSYDVLPVSFKLVVLDSTLSLKGSLLTLLQNGVVSAPVWNSSQSRFAGLLTASDFLNVIRYFINKPKILDELANVTLDDLKDIEISVDTDPLQTRSINPFTNLQEAAQETARSKAHRLPLVDLDPGCEREIVVSVLTQYRILRFVALNCKETNHLRGIIRDLGIITRDNLVTASIDTTLKEVVSLFSERAISSLPIVDEQGRLMNMYETFDVLTLIKSNGHSDLNMTVGEALMRRPPDFEGVLTCAETDTVADIMETIRRSRLLRLFVVDGNNFLKGVVSLCDILRYLLEG